MYFKTEIKTKFLKTNRKGVHFTAKLKTVGLQLH